MLRKVPARLRRSRKKQPVRRLKLRRLPSNRRGVSKIWLQRSKRSPRSPKRFNVAMVSRRPQARKKTDLQSADKFAVEAANAIASENLLIFRAADEMFALRLDTIAEII